MCSLKKSEDIEMDYSPKKRGERGGGGKFSPKVLSSSERSVFQEGLQFFLSWFSPLSEAFAVAPDPVGLAGFVAPNMNGLCASLFGLVVGF